LSADRYDKSVVDAIGNDIMNATNQSVGQGWDKFMGYFENTDLGKDYFQNAAWGNYDDNSSGLMGTISKISGVKMSIRISQMTHDWAGAQGWTRDKNALEHNIGLFLVSDSYGPNFAEFIGNSNEIRGLIINDRQNGQMMNALTGIGNTAFEWRDLKHNGEGIDSWRTYRNRPTVIQMNTSNGVIVNPWFFGGK
jgi:hypothetical protein